MNKVDLGNHACSLIEGFFDDATGSLTGRLRCVALLPYKTVPNKFGGFDIILGDPSTATEVAITMAREADRTLIVAWGSNPPGRLSLVRGSPVSC